MNAPPDNGRPDGWKHVRFGDVVRNTNNTTRDPGADGLDRIVGLTHLDSDSLPVRRWDPLSESTSFTRTFRAGQVLFGKRRAYQRKLGVPDFDGICSGDILVFESKSPDLLPEFLPYVVQSDAFFERAVGTSAGSLSPRTKWQDLAKYEFALPPFDEQQRIVELLGASDTTVEAYRRLIHEARQYTQSAAEEVFADDATVWEPLSTVLLEGPRNGVTIAPVERMTGCWGLTIGSAGDWGFDPSGTKSIAAPAAGDPAVVQEGDLFITRSNTQERVGLPFRAPQGLPETTYYSDLLIRLRSDPDQMPTWLLEVFLRSPRGRASIRAISAGTSASMKKINGRNLQRVLVPRPGDSAVTRLQILVQRIDTLIERAGVLEVDALRLRGSLATALLEGRA